MSSSRSENENIVVHIAADLASLIPQYLENKREDLETLKAALEQKDHKTLEEVAHLIKGSGTSYGFPALSALATEMENVARSGELDTLSGLIGDLEHFLDHVEVVYI